MLFSLARPALAMLDPEQAHNLTIKSLRLAFSLGLLRPRERTAASVKLLGIEFPNRLGLAAGFDKTGVCVDAMLALGFGFVEVGTVTPRGQPGNPKPRVFRLRDVQGVINRMGFPNEGVDALIEAMNTRRVQGICGINIGKNADTPIEDAASDYVRCLRGVYRHADYLVVNISSPNTKGLRTLQEPEQLRPVLVSLYEARAREVELTGKHVPVLIKIAPDLSDEQQVALAQLFSELHVEGVIATNTTLARDVLPSNTPHANEAGGLSGCPLHQRSLTVVRRMRELLGPSMVLIGAGGVASAKDARAMRAAGADLVQLYTALVYQGPALIQQIAMELERD